MMIWGLRFLHLVLYTGVLGQILGLARGWLQEEKGGAPTLLLMVVGVPNVGKSALINTLHRLGQPQLAGEGGGGRGWQ